MENQNSKLYYKRSLSLFLMYAELQVIIISTSVLFAVIGLYLAIRAWSSWTRTDEEVLRAKAFITIQFLHRNFMLIFLMGGFIALHTFLEFIEIFGYPSLLISIAKHIRILYFLTLTVSTLMLVLLGYYWCKLLSSRR